MENVVGHGSLTPSVFNPMGARGLAEPLGILVMTSELYPHGKVWVWKDKCYSQHF